MVSINILSCCPGDGFNTAITVLAILGKGFITVAYSAVYVVTAETYPTRIRNIGMGVSSSFGRLSGMGASFIGGYLVNGTSISSLSSHVLIHLSTCLFASLACPVVSYL